MIAVLFSVVALSITVWQWYASDFADKENLAARYCEDYYTGPKLAQQFQTIRSWDESAPMPEAVNRAYGDVFNFLNVVAMRWQRDSVDSELLRDCMGVAFASYCNPVIFSIKDGIVSRWKAVSALVTTREFWLDPKQAAACESAIK